MLVLISDKANKFRRLPVSAVDIGYKNLGYKNIFF